MGNFNKKDKQDIPEVYKEIKEDIIFKLYLPIPDYNYNKECLEWNLDFLETMLLQLKYMEYMRNKWNLILVAREGFDLKFKTNDEVLITLANFFDKLKNI